jgi:hypothetical protein
MVYTIMCIICSRKSTVKTTEILACHKVSSIPKKIINLKKLTCSSARLIQISKGFTQLTHLTINRNMIREIPKELVNLECLKCGDNPIEKLPNTLTKLTYLSCYNTGIREIPKELISLVKIRVDNLKITIPRELINLKEVTNCFVTHDGDNFTWDQSWLKTDVEIKKIIKLQRFIKLYIKLPILWNISEYYTKKKYSPENILKYINLEN